MGRTFLFSGEGEHSVNNTESAKNFCKNVKILRYRNALDIETMAAYIGVTANELIQIERGEIPFYMSVSVLFNIYENFGIPVQSLFAPLYEEFPII